MNKKFLALLAAALLLFNTVTALAETPADNSMSITVQDKTYTLDYDSDPDFSNVLNGVIQASFYTESSDGALYEVYLLFPEDVKSGDEVTTQSSIQAGDEQTGVTVFLTDDTLDLYAAAFQSSDSAYPSGSQYSIKFDSVVPSGNTSTFTGTLSATLIALDEEYKELYPVENVTASFSFTFDFSGGEDSREPYTPELPEPEAKPAVPNLPGLVTPPDAKKI